MALLLPFSSITHYTPTVLKSQKRLFSADVVGYTINHLQSSLGSNVCFIYFNRAQGDIIAIIFNENDRFDAYNLGKSLAETVKKIWDETITDNSLQIDTKKDSYAFKPQATPFGFALPIDVYKSEMNLIVFNQTHAFITVPGELSCLYDKLLKDIGNKLGFSHVSIFGLTCSWLHYFA